MTETATATLLQNNITADTVAACISTQKPLPKGIESTVLHAGVAQVLAKAGKAIAPQTANAKKVLASLDKVDTLAGMNGMLVATWLGLRAFGLPAGAQIAVTPKDLKDPIILTLIGASGMIPTTDVGEPVRGVWGALNTRLEHTLMSGARIIDLSCGGLIQVSNSTGLLFSVNLVDTMAALHQIDEKAPTRPRAKKVAKVTYNRVEDAKLNQFTASIFSSYKVRRIEVPNAQPHPSNLVESAALASVLPPVPSYEPHLPEEVISRGLLSDVQIESVIYAGNAHAGYLPFHPDDERKLPPRRGFLLGHGTGVGKGRIGAGIILDNWHQGRRRHIWVSESAHLIADARRDWTSLGGNEGDVLDIREYPSNGMLPPIDGIMFLTFASLRSEFGERSRLEQLVEWFGEGEDGVVLIDESQNLRHAKGKHKKTNKMVSQQGIAATTLQDHLPHSRVVYSSATSASDIVSLGYAVRLGLWGKDTAFRDARRFFTEMEEGGTNALEMVSRDLKAMGLYLAANLSFEGVSYERLEHKLNAEERATQDQLAELWLKIHDSLNRALSLTHASRLPANTKGRLHRQWPVHFSMARSRFFQALLVSLMSPRMIEAIRADLKAGHAPIVQLTNTFEANSESAIEGAADLGLSLDQVSASAKEILYDYARTKFPIHDVVAVKSTVNGKSITTSQIKTDANGNPVINPQAKALQDALIAEIDAIKIPEGPLEQLMRAFGTDTIAEITGRSRRLIGLPNGSKVVEERTAEDVEADLRDFVDDRKKILVFSQAGATGATYSAQRSFTNRRLRRHYVLQAGWRADLALQGMGRSHRSDQVQPPEYILMSTDLWASQRMASAVARGMRDLGALTRGLRQAASQDFFTQDENLEGEYGEAAWQSFVIKLNNDQIPGIQIGHFQRQACISLSHYMATGMVTNLPPVRRFLNAMSAMNCTDQAIFGQHYREELKLLTVAAIQAGTLDRGIETITPDSLIKLEDRVIYRDPRTGGETRLLRMLRVDELKPISYREARRKAITMGTTRIMRSLLTGRIAILSFPRTDNIRMDDPVLVITPTGSRQRTREEVIQERWMRIDMMMAEQMWEAEMMERGSDEEREFWVISGAMLPIWDKLPSSQPVVYRMETDLGEQIIGRVVDENAVSRLMIRVDALVSGGIPAAEVQKNLLKGGCVSLANGWLIEGRCLHNGSVRITLEMSQADALSQGRMIAQTGLKKTNGFYYNRSYFLIPDDPGELEKIIPEILSESIAVTVSTL